MAMSAVRQCDAASTAAPFLRSRHLKSDAGPVRDRETRLTGLSEGFRELGLELRTRFIRRGSVIARGIIAELSKVEERMQAAPDRLSAERGGPDYPTPKPTCGVMSRRSVQFFDHTALEWSITLYGACPIRRVRAHGGGELGRTSKETLGPSVRIQLIPTRSECVLRRLRQLQAVVVALQAQDIALPLMTPLGVEMVEIVAQCPPQRAFDE